MSLKAVLVLSAVFAFCVSGPSCARPSYLGVLPQGSAQQAKKIVKNTCSLCHGADGNSISNIYPNLAGQNYNYLLKELEDFNDGARKSSTMLAIIKTIKKSERNRDFENLAKYFAEHKLDRNANANRREKPAPSKALAMGYTLYSQGIRSKRVPACSACHLPTGLGIAPMAIPALAGQHAQYIDAQLKSFARGVRSNSPGHIMEQIASRLSANEINDVALYLQALNPDFALGIGPRTYRAYTQQRSKEPIPGIPAEAGKQVASSSKPSKSGGSGKAATQHRTAKKASN